MADLASLPILMPPSIHPTHEMIYAPCLFLECKKCMTPVRSGIIELQQVCEGAVYVRR